MVAPVPTAEVLLISRHPRRSLDLRRLGLEVRQAEPAALSGAPVLGAAGIVIIDALDGDTAAAELLATVGRHVEKAAVVVLLDEQTPAPAALGTQMRILRSPIRGQDVATAIDDFVEAPAPAESQPAEPPPVAAPPVPEPVAAPPVAAPAASPPPPPPAPAPATEPPLPVGLSLLPQPPAHPKPGPPRHPVPTQPEQDVSPVRERRFGRRRHVPDDAPAEVASTAPQAPALDWAAHAAAVLAGLHARPSWKEVAQAVVDDAAPALGPSACLLVRESDATWPVAAGVGLRELEFGLVVDDDHAVVGLGTKQHPVAVVPDTDMIRSDLIGAPLASRRCLLVALVFPLPVLLVIGRAEGPFDQADVKAAVGLVERWRWPLSSALQRRDLARALQRFA